MGRGEWNTRGTWHTRWFPEPVPDVWVLNKADYWEALAWRIGTAQTEPRLSAPPLIEAPPPEPPPPPPPEEKKPDPPEKEGAGSDTRTNSSGS